MCVTRLLMALPVICAFLFGYASPPHHGNNLGPAVSIAYAADAETGASPKHGHHETPHQPPAEEVKTFGNVRYYPAQHKIEFNGEINMRDSQGEPMELFACAPGGKTHEAVAAADIVPSDLHAALLEAGLMTYPYPNRVAADRQDLLGSRAIVWMVWTENGTQKRLCAEETLLDTRLNRPMGWWGWAFVGQYEIVTDKETGQKMRVYQPDSEKSLITNYHTPNSVLDNPRSQGAFDADYLGNTPVIPELKTKVTIVIEPATEERIVAENLKHEHDKELAVLLKVKLDKMPEQEMSEEKMAVSKELAIIEERVKWLETLVPLAKEADEWNNKILHEIDPAIKAKTDKLAEAAKAGDKNTMNALNAELENMYAEREVALKKLEKAYHYYYKSITEREAADGKALGVDEKKQAILDGDAAFYTDKEENVENELALAELRPKELQQNAALATTQDPAKRLEIQVALAELDRDKKILVNKIALFHLQPEIASVQSYIKAAEDNLKAAQAQKDDELVASYQKELDGHKARLEYLNNRVEAISIRQQTAQLECTVAVNKLKGEETPPEALKQLQALDAKASLLEKRAQIYELGEELKTVSDDLDIEIQTGGDPALIAQMQQKKKDIEDKIASLKSEIESLEKSVPQKE